MKSLVNLYILVYLIYLVIAEILNQCFGFNHRLVYLDHGTQYGIIIKNRNYSVIFIINTQYVTTTWAKSFSTKKTLLVCHDNYVKSKVCRA